MTLVLELTPEELARLEAEAQARGVQAETVLRDLIAQLPTRHEKRVLRAFGKYTHSPRSVEDFERESREDKAREYREEAG
jgi:hypothetical protein